MEETWNGNTSQVSLLAHLETANLVVKLLATQNSIRQNVRYIPTGDFLYDSTGSDINSRNLQNPGDALKIKAEAS